MVLLTQEEITMLFQQLQQQAETINNLQQDKNQMAKTIEMLNLKLEESNQTIKKLTERLGKNPRNSDKSAKGSVSRPQRACVSHLAKSLEASLGIQEPTFPQCQSPMKQLNIYRILAKTALRKMTA